MHLLTTMRAGRRRHGLAEANDFALAVALRSACGIFALAILALAAPAEARGDRNRQVADNGAQSSLHPMVVVVSTSQQHLKAYDASGKVVAEAPVSTGQSGHETPHGVFSIIAKERMHYSNLYDDAPMPWMERITWSGVALHAGHLPGYPASHGCIRLPHDFSRSLYGLTRMGTRVIVARDDPSPRSYAHAALFAPLPTEAAIAARAAGPTANAASADSRLSPAGLLGISPAHANGTKSVVRTREQAAAERAERIALAKTKLQEAEASKSTLDAAARAATEAAQKAHQNLQEEQAEAGRIDEARRELLAQIASAEKDILALATMARRADDDVDVEQGAEREQVLEDRLAALRMQADNAVGVVATQAAMTAAAEAAAQVARTRRVTALADLRQALASIEEARRALESQQRADANQARPISIFISRKSGRLYVRQGFDELFDTPIEIEQPELPVGTHVFTAVGETADTMALRWSVVTVQAGTVVSERTRDKRSGKRGAEAAPPDARTAAAASSPDRALERLRVSPEVRQRIAEFIKPGSSLIVSDHALNHETGRYTEFVVLTR